VLGSLGEFQPELMLDGVEDPIDREVQEAKGDGVFGLRHCRGSVLLGSWGPMPLTHILELSD